MITLLVKLPKNMKSVRQAVYDNIKRTEAMLEEYEAKLLLFQKFQERNKWIAKFKVLIEKEAVFKRRAIEAIIRAFEKLD